MLSLAILVMGSRYPDRGLCNLLDPKDFDNGTGDTGVCLKQNRSQAILEPMTV